MRTPSQPPRAFTNVLSAPRQIGEWAYALQAGESEHEPREEPWQRSAPFAKLS
jgi:hypothetical protein